MARYLILFELLSWALCLFFTHIVLGQLGIGPTAAAEYFGQIAGILEQAR